MPLTKRYDDGLDLHVVDRGVRWQMTLMRGDEPVSGLGLVKKRMRIGDAVVKMGGIAGVWTSRDHRKKGYASRVMWDSVDLMKQKGYETSILFGIRDFYHRYGFVEVFPETSLEIAAERIACRSSLKVRSGGKRDFAAFARLYNRHNRGRSGTVVRRGDWDPAWRLPGFGPGASRRPGKILAACAGESVRGYAVYDIQVGRCRVSEIVADDPMTHAALASALSRRARSGGVERLDFLLPPSDPFVQFCQRFGTRVGTRFAGDGGSMGRIVDLERLMKGIGDELWRRWDRIRVPWERPLSFVSDIGSVTLTRGRGSVRVETGVRRNAVRVSLPQEVLSLLVMGTRSVESVAADERVRISSRVIALTDALFPRGDAYVWWPDRF